jgi:5-methyltetrahydropteroyltriglutamate--homocysteine methyltransferase
MVQDRAIGEAVDPVALDDATRGAVVDIVRRQVETGIDAVSDGEVSKVSFANYVAERLSGLGDASDVTSPSRWGRDMEDFPGLTQRAGGGGGRRAARLMHCVGPISYVGTDALTKDLERFRAALAASPAEDAFLTAASPGIVALRMVNSYYPDDEACLYAVAEAMKTEYRAIVAAGFSLQLDCPDLAMARHVRFGDEPIDTFRAYARRHVEALNYAVSDIPPDQLRLHLCWGNYEGPHHRDVELKDIVDLVLEARPSGISFEACNPRHGHEWRVFETVKLPADKALIPGVIDSTTNFVEHPELVAERIVRYAGLVGRERVIAGTDCGFATYATGGRVDPDVAWAKLHSLAEGARLATAELW